MTSRSGRPDLPPHARVLGVLWGGPCDGQQVVLYADAQTIFVPKGNPDRVIAFEQIPDTVPELLGMLTYSFVGKDSEGVHVYMFEETDAEA